MSTYRCPRCGRSDNLYALVEVPGWIAVDIHLDDVTPAHGPDRDVDWFQVERIGEFGCGECEWEGRKDDFDARDHNGDPLPVIHPQQARLGETA